MFESIQSVTLMDNAVLIPSSLAGLKSSQNLQSFTSGIIRCTGGFRLEHFYFDNCQEINTIVLAGAVGIGIISPSANIKVVPYCWQTLTNVKTLSFGNCGFNSDEVKALLLGLNESINAGLGSAVLTGKVLLLNGTNAKLDITDASVNSAKTNITSKGWTITNN